MDIYEWASTILEGPEGCWPNGNPSQKMPVSSVAPSPSIADRWPRLRLWDAGLWTLQLGEVPSWQGLVDLNVLWLVATSTPSLPNCHRSSPVSFMVLFQSSRIGFLSQSVWPHLYFTNDIHNDSISQWAHTPRFWSLELWHLGFGSTGFDPWHKDENFPRS